MQTQNERNEKLEMLFSTLVAIDNIDDCHALFDDLCTVKEVQNMAERLYAAKLLSEGKTYNQVIAAADISSATLSRVSRCLQYGSGYRLLFSKESDKIDPQ